MQPIRTQRNLYRGVNAHLHSHFQAMGSWRGFHTSHLTHVLVALKSQVLPMGYTVDAEVSLQIRRHDGFLQSPRADLAIFDTVPERAKSNQRPTEAARTQGQVATLPALLDLPMSVEKPYRAIVIKPLGEPDTIVTWLELLSPSNKVYPPDAADYRQKRLQILDAGIPFVELDYLHETPALFVVPTESAYRIAVFEPRPTLLDGVGHVVSFGVDEPIPMMTIPLSADDTLSFDFNAPYQRTYSELLYGLELVDYAQLPANFETYNEADRARILSIMLAAADARQRGGELTADLPHEALDYGVAWARWSALQEDA